MEEHDSEPNEGKVAFSGEVPDWMSESIRICASFLTADDDLGVVERRAEKWGWRQLSWTEGFTKPDGSPFVATNGQQDLPYYIKTFGPKSLRLTPSATKFGNVNRRHCALSVTSFDPKPLSQAQLQDFANTPDPHELDLEEFKVVERIGGLTGRSEIFSMCRETFCSEGFKGHWSWDLEGATILVGAEATEGVASIVMETFKPNERS